MHVTSQNLICYFHFIYFHFHGPKNYCLFDDAFCIFYGIPIRTDMIFALFYHGSTLLLIYKSISKPKYELYSDSLERLQCKWYSLTRTLSMSTMYIEIVQKIIHDIYHCWIDRNKHISLFLSAIQLYGLFVLEHKTHQFILHLHRIIHAIFLFTSKAVSSY